MDFTILRREKLGDSWDKRASSERSDKEDRGKIG